ncbi:hypothetical protein GQ53DRAFT_326640 [Thozetella sp. PMI_491]|nr:hypothetical protein GQ53DRAFT_326640 [Thozetella sp. PMI_491]
MWTLGAGLYGSGGLVGPGRPFIMAFRQSRTSSIFISRGGSDEGDVTMGWVLRQVCLDQWSAHRGLPSCVEATEVDCCLVHERTTASSGDAQDAQEITGLRSIPSFFSICVVLSPMNSIHLALEEQVGWVSQSWDGLHMRSKSGAHCGRICSCCQVLSRRPGGKHSMHA